MAVMRVDHPDILEFIEAKQKNGTFENFNFSIGIIDDFMERVINNDDSPWLCEWESQKMNPRYITCDESGRIVDISEWNLSTPELMNEIIHCAWSNGEPVCIFIDTINKFNPFLGLGRIEFCNPSGEQFLHSGDAWNLGAINLQKFVKEDGTFDFEHLKEVTRVSVRILDNVIDLTEFPVDRVENMFMNNRRIGIGIIGLADVLFLSKLTYNSEEDRQLSAEIMKIIQESAIDESVKIGAEKGNFSSFKKSKWGGIYPTMRNASLTNVTQIGSTSMLFDVSSDVEPYFALEYRRGNCLAGKMEPFINKHLKKALIEANCYNDEVMDLILQTGTLQNVRGDGEGFAASS